MPRPSEKIEPWWEAPEGEAHERLRKLVEHLEAHPDEKRRKREYLMHMALYGDKRARRQILGSWDGADHKFNLCKAICDAYQAEIASMQPKPTFLTSRGDWGQKRRAQAMELTVVAEYEANDVYGQMRQGCLDAAKVGTTGFKVYNSDWRPKIELLQPGTILVDPMEAMHGSPKSVYELQLVSRHEALGRWGKTLELREAIEKAPSEDARKRFPWLPTDTLVDQVLVIEATREPDPENWHENGDGRHVVICQGVTLVDEPWDRSHPYCIHRHDTESSEYWGTGMVESLKAAQLELNDTLAKIGDCIGQATNRVWIEEGSNIDVDQIDDDTGGIHKYLGTPPIFEAANTVPEQLFRHAEDIIRRAFEQEGMSQLSAMGRKPAGLNSGAALREHNDIGSQRFIIKSQDFEQWIGVKLAKKVVDEKRWIANQEGAKPPPIQAEVRRGRNVTMKTIAWNDAALEEDTYGIQVFPSSALPSTPAGRIATVEDWMGSGLLSREQGMALLDFPDLEEFVSAQQSTQALVLFHVEVMLEDGEFMPPEPLQDLSLSIELAKQAALRAMTDGAPEDHVDLVYQYIDDLRSFEESAMAEAAQMQAPPPAGAFGGSQPSPPPAAQMAAVQA